MIIYLASETPLPTGEFISRPNAIYKNYTMYKQSNEYFDIKSDNIYVAPPYDFVLPMHSTNYPVHIYNKSSRLHALSINRFIKDIPRTIILKDIGEDKVQPNVQMKAILDQDVTKQFSLPYIYYLGSTYSETALREYLCVHLLPRKKAELYMCWRLSEKEDRISSWDQIVDLQSFVENGDINVPTSDYAESNYKRFVTYIAPKFNNLKFDYLIEEDAIIICTDSREEFIPFSLAEKILGKADEYVPSDCDD